MTEGLVPFEALRLTRDIPGIGGRFKAELDDFAVDELPRYALSGEGQHTFVRIEKRGISTYEAIRRLSAALGVAERDIGHAGLKDAHAVTTQWLSLEGVDPARATGLELPKVRVLEATRHGNKLRKGHLAGNRFRCVLRGVDPEGEARARAVLERLTQVGVPNAFGPQRFGDPPRNHFAGRAIVRGDEPGLLDLLLGPLPLALAGYAEREGPAATAARERYAAGEYEAALAAWPARDNQERRLLKILRDGGDAASAVRTLPRKLKELFVNAYQSALFNRLLAQRLAAGMLATLERGDVAYRHEGGASFLVEEAAAEQPRADAGEISPSGPLFGTKTLLAQDEPGRREQAVLDAEGLRPESFQLRGGLTQRGERRPYRFRLIDAELHWGVPRPGTCTVSFTLNAGCYATNVLAELVGPPEPDGAAFATA